MKRKKTNLDKNISRLVKLTRESDIPGEKFVDSLINDALNELDQPQQDQQRVERNTTMKFTLKTMAWAAGFILIATLAATVMMPNLGMVKKLDQKVATNYRPESQESVLVRTDKPTTTKSTPGLDLNSDVSGIVAVTDSEKESPLVKEAKVFAVRIKSNGLPKPDREGVVAARPSPMKPIPIVKPKPMYVGTPQNIDAKLIIQCF